MALVDSIDQPTQDVASEILHENGIDSTMEDSVVYSIDVHKLDLDKARNILNHEARLRGNRIEFLEKNQRPTPGVSFQNGREYGNTSRVTPCGR